MASPTSNQLHPFDMQKYFLPTSPNASSPSSGAPSQQPSLLSQIQTQAQTSGIPSTSLVPPSSPPVGPGSSPSSAGLMMSGNHPQLLPSSSFPPLSAPGPHHVPGHFPSSYLPNQLHSPFQPLPSYSPSTVPLDHASPNPLSHLNPTLSNPNHHYPSANPHHYSIPQRSLSYPTPTLQPQPQIPPMIPQRFNPDRSGAEIMALLRPPTAVPSAPPPEVPPYVQVPPIIRMPSSASAKQPRGRRIPSNQSFVEYDVDVRLPGEVQPQLEVTPITKYVTDPQLCLGRQIAVNNWYICYGLKQGNIRILNINTALRSLFRTQSQRVTDMAFFAEDVHLLASAGVDGRIVVWKISEGPDEEDKPQIAGKTVIAVQIVGVDEIKSPRVCWHCYKQEILVVGVGKFVLKIDTNRVGKGDTHNAETPLQCSIDNLPEGIQLIGNHEGEVTDLSMCQWMSTRLVSASTDGTIKVWEDNKAIAPVVLMPYDGQPVFSATFLTAPNRPDHIVLVTAGPLNREVKIWVAANEEGWLLPRDTDVLNCIQTLELKSSSEMRAEDAFFNQTVALSQVGLLLFANAKRNAIYVVHIDYGGNPAATRMDYVSEFSVAMPILSLTGTSDVMNGQSVAQIYCVQTQAIQQYTLDLCQCLPPDADNLGWEKSDSAENLETFATDGFAYHEQNSSKAADHSVDAGSMDVVVQQNALPNIEKASVPSIPLHCDNEGTHGPNNHFPDNSFSNMLESCSFVETVSNQPILEYPIDQHSEPGPTSFSDAPSYDEGDLGSQDKVVSQEDSAGKSAHSISFKHPTHLITPSEILMGASSPEITDVTESFENQNESPSIQDSAFKIEVGNEEVEVNMVDETKSIKQDDFSIRQEPSELILENKEKIFSSQASGLGIEMARERSVLSSEAYMVDDRNDIDGDRGTEYSPSSDFHEGKIADLSAQLSESTIPTVNPQTVTPISKGKNKGKNVQASGSNSPSPNTFNVTGSISEIGGTSVEEMLGQLLSSQKEMQKNMLNLISVPISKECKKLETALGKNIEKIVKANTDGLWARLQEENAKNDKRLRERTQQIFTLLSNFINKDMPAMLEKAVKKEVTRSISPVIEKTVSSAIAESFQKGVGDKAVSQLEKLVNSKLEATVARQIQAQFQTSGKQALQEALKSSIESSLIPSFDKSCKAMFEQVDATFQKGMAEHTHSAQHHFETSHSQLAITLRDVLNSASSLTQTLNSELVDNQRKLIALAAAGANSTAGANPIIMQLSNGPANIQEVEAQLDPAKELNRLISSRKYDEAFNFALQRSDVSMVSWLCTQVDLHAILSMDPVPLSQGVLLSLLQQLGCDIGRDTGRKLAWMTDVASAINPNDPMIALHIRHISEQVLHVLRHLKATASLSGPDNSAIRVLIHVITSVLASCK